MLAAVVATAFTFVPQGPLQLEITPKDNAAVAATWTPVPIALDTDFGTATVKPERLEQIVFGEPDVVIAAGVEVRGKLKLAGFDTKVDGKARRFATKDLASLVVLKDGKALGAPSFDGEWMTSFGEMKLEQKGLVVKGTSGFKGSTQIEGKVEKGVLQFTYESDNGGGKGQFELQAKDDAMFGRYEGGSDSKGFWGGYRKAPKQAAAKPGEVAVGQVGNGMRYQVRLPKAHTADKKWPAICILHGSNMTSRAYVDTIVAAWPELAEQFVVVGLDGEHLSSNSKPGALAFNYTYVNFSGDQGYEWAKRQSPALVAEALQQLGKELPVTKWFLGGHSQGGFLTYAVVMYFPDLVAGAFPMSCNLLVQCEPDGFDAGKAMQQRNVALAVMHGKRDDVVDYGSGAYCHMRMIDGGFPFVRLFAPDNVGHQFGLMPVDEAVRWLAAVSSDDPEVLIASAEKAADETRWRDVGALVQRAKERKAAGPLVARADEVQKKLTAAAWPAANKLGPAIDNDGGEAAGKWVDDFLAFRRDFGTAEAAAPVIAAYARLRKAQKKQGDELFGKWRSAEKGARAAIYEQIVATCYATKWYEAVKLWTK